MPKPDKNPSGGNSPLQQFSFVAVMAIALGVLLLASLAAYFADRRMNRLEERISRRPAKDYAAPDLAAFAASPIAEADVARRGSVYVPIHSHVYFNGGRPLQLETTLSIRNASAAASVYVESVRYYDTDGELVKSPVDRLIELGPLQSIEFVVEQRDSSGGTGANFLVDWLATAPGPDPLVEAVMVGTAGPQGIAFRAVGVAVTDQPPTE